MPNRHACVSGLFQSPSFFLQMLQYSENVSNDGVDSDQLSSNCSRAVGVLSIGWGSAVSLLMMLNDDSARHVHKYRLPQTSLASPLRFNALLHTTDLPIPCPQHNANLEHSTFVHTSHRITAAPAATTPTTRPPYEVAWPSTQ